MLRARLWLPTPSSFTDHQSNATPSLRVSSFPIRVRFGVKSRSYPKSFVVFRCSASGSSSVPFSRGEDRHSDFLEASILVPVATTAETVSHYRKLRRGSSEEVKWQTTGKMPLLSVREREPRAKFTAIGQGFLNRFQVPTIFLKISCDGDFLLPIIVGEFAIENLIESLLGGDSKGCPDQFHFLKNVVHRFGFEVACEPYRSLSFLGKTSVKMVRIIERVNSTYFAKICISKPGDNDVFSVDARPSDAINVASRCKAPIYVNRNIVLTDAIRIGYDMGRVRHGRATYDVLLDSAADGPDPLTEELIFVNNMNLAVQEERYIDAVMWRDRLMKLRDSKHDS